MTFTRPLIAAVALIAGMLSSHGLAESPVQRPSDVKGVSWSDPRDNYNPGRIVPAGLMADGTAEQAAAVARTYAGRARGIGANVVRLGINPATVADAAWWPIYARAIRTLADEGLGVILCAWEQSPTVAENGRATHDGRFGAGTVDTYAAMWQAVHRQFSDVPNVIGYELLNEPFGYRKDHAGYARDMRKLMAGMGSELHGKHVLIAGIGYSDDVQALRDLFPEPAVWFAYHLYPNWFGAEAGRTVFTRQQYADEIASHLKGVEDRTVITEFGCWGGDAFAYDKPAAGQRDIGARRHVSYLQAMADVCERMKIGSVYWYANALDARGKRSYDLFANDGQPLDQDRLTQVRRAWRLPADK